VKSKDNEAHPSSTLTMNEAQKDKQETERVKFHQYGKQND
jgi:hypothetical protein